MHLSGPPPCTKAIRKSERKGGASLFMVILFIANKYILQIANQYQIVSCLGCCMHIAWTSIKILRNFKKKNESEPQVCSFPCALVPPAALLGPLLHSPALRLLPAEEPSALRCWSYIQLDDLCHSNWDFCIDYPDNREVFFNS